MSVLTDVQTTSRTLVGATVDNDKTVKADISPAPKTKAKKEPAITEITPNITSQRTSSIIPAKLLPYDCTMLIESLRKISTANTIKPPNNTVKNDGNLTLDSETLLVLDLLTMGYNARINFLLDVAKECHLIISDKQTKLNIVNPLFLTFNQNKYPEVATFIELRDKIETKTPPVIQCDPVELATYRIASLNIILFDESKKYNKSTGSILTRHRKNEEKECIPITTDHVAGLEGIPVDKNENVNVDPIARNSDIVEQTVDVISASSENNRAKRVRKRGQKKAKTLNVLPKPLDDETCSKKETINEKISRIKAKIQIQLNTIYGELQSNVDKKWTSKTAANSDLLLKPNVDDSIEEVRFKLHFFFIAMI